MQIKCGLRGVGEDKIRKMVIAYEPIWAIGTGKTATPEQAEEVCESIRTVIRKLYGAKIARAISILYGGSMNEKNAYDLLAQPDIDGGRSCGWHLRRGGHPPDRAVYAKARRLTGRKSFDSVKRSASRCFYTITRLPLRKGKSGLLPERFMIP